MRLESPDGDPRHPKLHAFAARMGPHREGPYTGFRLAEVPWAGLYTDDWLWTGPQPYHGQLANASDLGSFRPSARMAWRISSTSWGK